MEIWLASSPLDFVVPPTKKNLSGKIPRGVCAYLPATARLTVEMCTPTSSAISCMRSGLSASAPRSRKPRWCSKTAFAIRERVDSRCAMASISQLAASSRFLANSRSSFVPSFSIFLMS